MVSDDPSESGMPSAPGVTGGALEARAPAPPQGEKRVPQQGDRDWYGEQNADGVDLSLIRGLLALAPWERFLKVDRHAREVRMLMEYGRRLTPTCATGARRGTFGRWRRRSRKSK